MLLTALQLLSSRMSPLSQRGECKGGSNRASSPPLSRKDW